MNRFAAGLAALTLAIPPAAMAQGAPSPERLKLAHEVLDAQGGLTNVNTVMRNLMNGISARMAAGLKTEDQEALKGSVDGTLEALAPRVMEITVRLFASDFDDKQLADILAFYQSPTGKALVARSPEFARQSSAAIGALMPSIQLSMITRFCAKSDCPPPVLNQITTLRQSIPDDQRF